MNQYFEQLVKIYNTLLMVNTSGENTIIMGQCLGAMREVLTNMQSENTAEENDIAE